MNLVLETILIAQRYGYNDHMDDDWWVMALVMAIFWASIVLLLVWALRHGGLARRETPEDILRRRLADGTLSVEEFEARREALRKSD